MENKNSHPTYFHVCWDIYKHRRCDGEINNCSSVHHLSYWNWKGAILSIPTRLFVCKPEKIGVDVQWRMGIQRRTLDFSTDVQWIVRHFSLCQWHLCQFLVCFTFMILWFNDSKHLPEPDFCPCQDGTIGPFHHCRDAQAPKGMGPANAMRSGVWKILGSFLGKFRRKLAASMAIWYGFLDLYVFMIYTYIYISGICGS